MPSPFPGIDPYLEDPETWRGEHHRFIPAADELLQPRAVPRGYLVDIESRIWLETPEWLIYPDVALLRSSESLKSDPTATLKPIQPGKCVINVLRGGSVDYELYPVELRWRLPKMGIPLKSGEPDVVLELQAALARVYEAGVYQMRIDYNRDPVPPSIEADATWADEWLIARGARSPH